MSPFAANNARLAPHNRLVRQAQRRFGQYFTVLLFAIFFILLLLALWLGTVSFRSIVDAQDATNSERLALNSLQNRVRANDAAGSFSMAEGPEGKALVFSQVLEAGTYETRIYRYRGSIVEEAAFSGEPFTPEKATEVAASDTFDFTFQDRLLTITCDQGTIDVYLRTGQSVTYPPVVTTTPADEAEGEQDA